MLVWIILGGMVSVAVFLWFTFKVSFNNFCVNVRNLTNAKYKTDVPLEFVKSLSIVKSGYTDKVPGSIVCEDVYRQWNKRQ